MKGKRYTTEDKIRVLREVDGGKTVQEGVPGKEHRRADLLSLEAGFRDDGYFRGAAAQRAGEGEQRVKENAGRGAVEKSGVGGGMRKKL